MGRKRIYTPEQMRERLRERWKQYRIKNREKIKAYKQSEGYRQKRKGYNRRYAEKHPDYMAKWRAAHPDYMRKWQAENKDRLREYHREYARKYASADAELPRSTLTPEERRERIRESKRKWLMKNYEREMERHRQWRKAHPEKERERRRRNYAKLTPEQRKERAHLKQFKRLVCEMLDCNYYARNRRKAREAQYKRWAKQGKNWCKGKPAMRIPDWCVRGGVLDARSPFLFENATPEQKAWARELCIEKKEWRQNNEWRLTR